MKKKHRLARFIRNHASLVLLVLGIAGFRTGYADWSHIPSGSMEPTFYDGDYVWIDKRTLGPSVPFLNMRLLTWGAPGRGDVVTFVPPHTDELYIKRVIGLPGDAIFLDDRDVFVNGEKLPTVYAAADEAGVVVGVESIDGAEHSIQLSTGARLPTLREQIVVPPNHYFVMGDHRDNSSDSRFWGFVPEERIMGRVTHVAVSFSERRPFRERFALPVQ